MVSQQAEKNRILSHLAPALGFIDPRRQDDKAKGPSLHSVFPPSAQAVRDGLGAGGQELHSTCSRRGVS